MKRVSILLLTLALLLGLAVTAQAREIPDPNRLGSITFQMHFNGEPLSSGSLRLYRVGDIAQQDGDYVFALISDLKDSGLSLENLEDVQLPGSLAVLAVERELTPVVAPIRDGEAVFADLLPGLYVVTQREEDACDGFAPIRPFLISLPRWNAETYLYDLTAKPKVSLETEPTEPPETEPPEPSEPWLPQTGQLNWPVPAMAVSGLALFAAGWFLCFGKKERHET